MRFLLCISITMAACAVAAAANSNAHAVTLHLSAADYAPATTDTNGNGTRLLAVGAASNGLPGVNGAGATLIVDPLSALNITFHSSMGEGESEGETEGETVYGGIAAEFTATPEIGMAPLTVQFIDTSDAGFYTVTAWEWDFGDGSPVSSEEQPAHVYTASGVYDVRLAILTSNGMTGAVTRTAYITVEGTPAPAGSRFMLPLLVLLLALCAVFPLRRRWATPPCLSAPNGERPVG